MNPTFRLSRIRAPRSTIAAILLLTAFFVAVGVAVAGTAPLAASVSIESAAETGLAEALSFLDALIARPER